MSKKHERSNDSGGPYGKVFSIAVVGLSGTEKDKGCLGVGKSCLCNRFVRPQADEYNRDHISVLSQTDFSGPIVNNEHWLYWGETRKCTDEGFELTFSIIEQTEFVDDACFQPFRSGKMEPYYKRCSATKLSSSEKLMYICKNQLGVEKEYDQIYLPDGRFNVDGFICVFDVSEMQGRDISRQVELTALILGTLLKTKKPVILVTTKNDEVYPPFMKEAEKLVSRREFKGMIPLVETSAHDNVNVDLAFWACVQRDWTKGKTKILTYQDSFQRQRDRLEMVNDNYLSLIRTQITDYRSHWNNTYSNLSQSHEFLVYCDLFGQESAQQTFKRHVRKLRDDYVCRKMQMYLRVLPKVLAQLLPDLESFGPDQSWPAVQKIIQMHPMFDTNFVVNESLMWQDMDDSSETRIPFDLLMTPEAEKVFVDHRDALLKEEHLRSLRHQFGELLRETSIASGQSLNDIRLLLAGRECVETLPETELAIIYEDYQRLLQERAREQLLELFLERAPLFHQYCTGNVVTQEDLAAISQKLMDDERWAALDLLPQDRDLALIRHLGFIQWPIKEHCPSYHACVDINTEAFCSSLAKRSRHPLWNNEPEEIHVKLIVLGSSSLAENLANVVKAMRSSIEQENSRVFLDVQISSGSEGIGLLESRLYSNSVEPEAYLCVYSNRSSLEYVRKSLEQSLLTDLQFGNPHHANPVSIGLPLVLLLATSPEVSSKERSFLREEGQNRAQNLQCAFFDVTSDEPHARFKSDELLRALIFLTDCVSRRADLMHVYNPASLNSMIPEGALNPEIRILLSLMCGDPILPAHFLELLLLPNSFPNTAFYPISKNSIVTDVGYLVAIDEGTAEADADISEIPSRYVEFVLTSYHGAYSYKDELIHGHILVYWTKRQASFSNMSALASTIADQVMPIQILALVENESRPSKLSHQLVAEGKELAESLNHQIEKCLQVAPSTVQAQQQSPHSVIGGSNADECYDPNVDQHFGSMLVPTHQLHQLHHDAEPNEPLTDTIYERLPGEQASVQPHESLKPEIGYQHGLPTSLVRQSRNDARNEMHSFNTRPLEQSSVGAEDGSLSFYPSGVFEGDNDEQLIESIRLSQHIRIIMRIWDQCTLITVTVRMIKIVHRRRMHSLVHHPMDSIIIHHDRRPPLMSCFRLNPISRRHILVWQSRLLRHTRCRHRPTAMGRLNQMLNINFIQSIRLQLHWSLIHFKLRSHTFNQEKCIIHHRCINRIRYIGHTRHRLSHMPILAMIISIFVNIHWRDRPIQSVLTVICHCPMPPRVEIMFGRLIFTNWVRSCHYGSNCSIRDPLRLRSILPFCLTPLVDPIPIDTIIIIIRKRRNIHLNRDLLSRLRKRRSEEKSKRRKDRIVPHDDEKSGNIVTLETNKDGANKIKTESTKKTLEEHEDSDSEVVDYDGTIEPEEDEDETVSSNNSANDQLLKASADRYALSSGWAYHQTNEDDNRSPSSLRNNWPPPQANADDDNNSVERFKAPGKLDLKRFNNLSDAIGRLNLNSPTLPLGPTRVSPHSSFENADYSANLRKNFMEFEQMVGGASCHPRRGGRLKNKQFSLNNEADSESETSDTNQEKKSITSNTFNSLKPLSLSPLDGSNSKRLQPKGKRRVAPVPVAPPRLPSSATNSAAVTPTGSCGNGRLFMPAGSFDDSQHDKVGSEASDSMVGSLQDDGKTIDLEQSQLGETRRYRMNQMSKLFSLQQLEGKPTVAPMAGETSATINIDSGSMLDESIDGSTPDKKQVLKSKSIGTFTEIDNSKKANRKAEKLEKKRQKEEERKSRKASKEAGSRNRSRSKSSNNHLSTSPLEAFAQADGNAVPLFIEKCTHFIEQEGLDMEGIYRVPGNRAHVDTLLLQFDENPDINITELDIPVNAVATALKDFFMKRLPPIFPDDCMEDIANLSRQYTDTGVLGNIRTFLTQLPNSNFQIIQFMISHFVKVVSKSSINSMDSKNLAICWWPTLLQFEFSDMFVFEQMRPHLMNFVQIMIDSFDDLFAARPNTANSNEELTNLSNSADELASL
ncbi:hypothetical protein RDWZM_003314 [Blomia tropicalis]|uniref:Rho GTPase-activating protein 190 n=1 Tax=Blomia tropicalis TaxID=40697 RepID=A0A9Q0RSE8_BLOTA|nr:hypothetical protein RDWZM_003314 [Blomia tropicalis]